MADAMWGYEVVGAVVRTNRRSRKRRGRREGEGTVECDEYVNDERRDERLLKTTKSLDSAGDGDDEGGDRATTPVSGATRNQARAAILEVARVGHAIEQ